MDYIPFEMKKPEKIVEVISNSNANTNAEGVLSNENGE